MAGDLTTLTDAGGRLVLGVAAAAKQMGAHERPMVLNDKICSVPHELAIDAESAQKRPFDLFR